MRLDGEDCFLLLVVLAMAAFVVWLLMEMLPAWWMLAWMTVR